MGKIILILLIFLNSASISNLNSKVYRFDTFNIKDETSFKKDGEKIILYIKKTGEIINGKIELYHNENLSGFIYVKNGEMRETYALDHNNNFRIFNKMETDKGQKIYTSFHLNGKIKELSKKK